MPNGGRPDRQGVFDRLRQGRSRVGCQRFKYIARSVHVRLFGLAYAKWRTPLLFLLVLVSFGVLEYGWRHIPKTGINFVQTAKGYLTTWYNASQTSALPKSSRLPKEIYTHLEWTGEDTCPYKRAVGGLAAARSTRGSDCPLDSHSLPLVSLCYARPYKATASGTGKIGKQQCNNRISN